PRRRGVARPLGGRSVPRAVAYIRRPPRVVLPRPRGRLRARPHRRPRRGRRAARSRAVADRMSERSSGMDALLLALAAALPASALLILLGARPLWPAGLALAGLAVPLILLHLLRQRRQRRTVGSLFLWAEVEQSLQSATPFRRLRRSLVLALELAALALLA